MNSEDCPNTYSMDGMSRMNICSIDMCCMRMGVWCWNQWYVSIM